MTLYRREHDSRAIGIRRLMARLNADACIRVLSERPVTVAIEVVEASANIELHLADIDLILPETRMNAIGLIGLPHDRKFGDTWIRLTEVGQVDRREFVEAAVLGDVGSCVEVTI